MDTDTAKKLSKLACDIRRKSAYMHMIPSDPDKRNFEQEQGAAAVLEKVALDIETLIAKEFLHANPVMLLALSRHCRQAIKQEIRRKEVKQEYAALC